MLWALMGLRSLQAHSSFIGRKILCKTLGTLMVASKDAIRIPTLCFREFY